MTRKWNFSAGPAALPEAVLQTAREELLDWHGQGASVMELSHRGRAFMDMASGVEADLRALMGVPDNYRVLFLHGGATQHFAQVPMNLALPGARAGYIVSGHWGEKAVREAAPYVDAQVVASSQHDGYRSLPRVERLDGDAAYVHYTPNETIHGIEFPEPPEVGELPLVADMSSDILSRPIEVARFGLIYAGAQKNIGPSGLVVMLIREDLLERPKRPMAKVFDYAAIAARDSMLNTPNTWAWYVAGLTFKWLADAGGLGAVAACNQAKAQVLYAAIDDSGGFYVNPVDRGARSRMNVPFFLPDEDLERLFVQEAEQAGMFGLKGHRSVGGIRASLYNAMPLQGVETLAGFMREFARRQG